MKRKFCFIWFLLVSSVLLPWHLSAQAVYSLGEGNECQGCMITGTYKALQPLAETEKVLLQANVTSPGHYLVQTEVVNGMQFIAEGQFEVTGIQLVVLHGKGAPQDGMTTRFRVTGNEGSGSCTFEITVSPWECGMNFTDYRDSQQYRTVNIGNQCWMAQNLDYGEQINYQWNQKNNGITEKYCYLGNKSNCDIYGALYQWDEAMQYTSNEGAKGVCPPGWHIPTDREWCMLTTAIDPAVDCQVIGASGNSGGGEMKSTGTTYWSPPNDGATDFSGFSAMPGGHRDYPGSFASRSYIGFFWTSTACGPAHAWIRSLHYFDNKVNRDDYVKSNGFSVRCVKDSR